jgi:DNA-binding MarR family transcriptional regulator
MEQSEAKEVILKNKMDTLNSVKCAEIGKACVCGNLRKANRLISQIYDEFLKPSGLKATQSALLMTIKGFGRVTVSKLAKWSIMDRTTLTRNLKVLEKKGLVKIQPGEDQRKKVVTITEKGIDALLYAYPFWEEAQHHVAEMIGEDKSNRIVKELSDMVSLLRKK